MCLVWHGRTNFLSQGGGIRFVKLNERIFLIYFTFFKYGIAILNLTFEIKLQKLFFLTYYRPIDKFLYVYTNLLCVYM